MGLTKPMVDLPAAIRSSLMRLRIAAKVGVEADVPPMRVATPMLKISTLSPIAETSGYPRPLML